MSFEGPCGSLAAFLVPCCQHLGPNRSGKRRHNCCGISVSGRTTCGLCVNFVSFEGLDGPLLPFVIPRCPHCNALVTKTAAEKRRHSSWPSKPRYLCVRSPPMWLSCWDLHISRSNCPSLSRSKEKTSKFAFWEKIFIDRRIK